MSIKNKYSIKCKVNTDIYEDCGFKKLICVSDFEENIIHNIHNIYMNYEIFYSHLEHKFMA